MSLDAKINQLKVLLDQVEREFSPAAFASSFGAEDMVLLDLIAREFSGIQVFTLDTGRLPKETIELMEISLVRYGKPIHVLKPQPDAVENYVQTLGANAFYESIENRKSCCHIRKVEPLGRALGGMRAWLTGLRREQAASRANLMHQETDATHGLIKFNPLLDWTNEDVWAYIRANDVPYNALHDRGYPSIGCEPCTRAVKSDEDPRAGRWWWESEAGKKECGLHVAELNTGAKASVIPKYSNISIKVTS
jgi:phosphoadenosine phosphosulfate reductase